MAWSPDLYINKLEENFDTPDDSDIGYSVEVDLEYTDKIKETTRIFQIPLENKIVPKDKHNDYMTKTKPKKFTKSKNLICDWTDKKNYLIHYRMLKFYVRLGMVVERLHELILFQQSKWLEKNIYFNTEKRNKAKINFQKDFYKLLNNAFYGKAIENVRICLTLEFIKKDDYEKIMKQQSKRTFNGIHKSYENCDSYTFKQNEVLMDKPIYLGFAVLELKKLHLYETYYDKLQPYFGKENIQLHYKDTDAFVVSLNTKDIIRDLKTLEDVFDFSNLDKNHELFINEKSNW